MSPDGRHVYALQRFYEYSLFERDEDPSGRVSLRWESRHEEGLTRYDVLRAYGVEPYETVRSVSPIGGPQRETIYEVDAGDSAPGAVSWRLQMTFESGRVTFSEPVVTIFPPEREVVLTGPYPNPASGSATLRVTLAGPGDVRVDLFDALGRRIRRVFSGRIEARVAHAVELDLAGLAAGQYFLHARADSPRGTFQSTAAVTVSR